MPIYEYQCTNCQVKVQHYQSLSESSPVTCDNCGEDTLKRVFSIFASQMKRSNKEIIQTALKMAREDLTKLRKGDEETLHDIAGETAISRDSAQVRYYDPSKAAGFKRTKTGK